MPILGPGGNPIFLISDLASEVIIKVENRITDISRAYVWVRDALIEISSDPDYRDEFCELEVFGPQFNLTGGSTTPPAVQEYPESNLITAGDINIATLDILIWRNPPFNTIRQKLNPSHYQETDKSVVVNAVPISWYRFGNNIGFYPVPDLNYQVQTRVLRMHPINDQVLQATPILLPRDWNDILIWAAAERGFMELEEYEKANAIHTMLHGDPKYPSKPGIMNGRKKKRAKEAWRTTGRLRPIVGSYINK
jgi:hypothetical protein